MLWHSKEAAAPPWVPCRQAYQAVWAYLGAAAKQDRAGLQPPGASPASCPTSIGRVWVAFHLLSCSLQIASVSHGRTGQRKAPAPHAAVPTPQLLRPPPAAAPRSCPFCHSTLTPCTAVMRLWAPQHRLAECSVVACTPLTRCLAVAGLHLWASLKWNQC
jgi:hypothetical protein